MLPLEIIVGGQIQYQSHLNTYEKPAQFFRPETKATWGLRMEYETAEFAQNR